MSISILELSIDTPNHLVFAVVNIRYIHLHRFIKYHFDGAINEHTLFVVDELFKEAAVGFYPRSADFNVIVRF